MARPQRARVFAPYNLMRDAPWFPPLLPRDWGYWQQRTHAYARLGALFHALDRNRIIGDMGWDIYVPGDSQQRRNNG